MVAADGPLSTSIDSMSSGLRSFTRLGLSWPLKPKLRTAAWLFERTPSM
jgi:hypothetical protein